MKKFKYKHINRYFYIYLRETKEKFNKKEVYKLGCTTNLYNRDNQYKTSEVNKKKFIKIIRFTPINIININKECKDIEYEYKKQYKYCNIINNDGGKEFYKIGINTSISYFTKENEEFEKYKPVIITDEKEIEQEIFNNRINPDSEENHDFNKMFQSKINYINKFKKLKPKTAFVNVNKRIKEIYKHKYNEEFKNEEFKNELENKNSKSSDIKINTNIINTLTNKNFENKQKLIKDNNSENKQKLIKNDNPENKQKLINKKIKIINKIDHNQDNETKELEQERKEYKLIITGKYPEYLELTDNPISLKMYIDYYKTHHTHPPIIETIDDNILKSQEYHEGIYKDLSGFQTETLDNMINYYKTNTKGYLNVCCRMGKTRLSLCFIRYMKFNSVIVFVPANVLLDQWEAAIKQILPSYKVIKYNPSNKKINKQQDKTIYISHYINSDQFINNNYEFKIFDELHHLTCIDLDK